MGNVASGSTNITAIKNAKIFDGQSNISQDLVVFDEAGILNVGGIIPGEASVIDARGSMLVPGFFDAHVHTHPDGLRTALRFGITTELEMMGPFTKKVRDVTLQGMGEIADVKSAGLALTAPGGHPSELLANKDIPPEVIEKIVGSHDDPGRKDIVDERTAIEHVNFQVENGADYIKIMIEDGRVLKAPGLPTLSPNIMRAAVEESHRLGKLVLAHVLTAQAAKTAIEVGVDGLAHVFVDRPSWTPDLIKLIADRGAFVTPCLVLNSSLFGNTAEVIAKLPKVRPKLSREWFTTMCSCFDTFPQGKMQDCFQNVADLHDAGIDILVGTDVSVPVRSLGGLAHGASVHHEMKLLVQAGLTPAEALRAATGTPARRFELHDRGQIARGKRADLVLIAGNPTRNICDTLSIKSVWKQGKRMVSQIVPAGSIGV